MTHAAARLALLIVVLLSAACAQLPATGELAEQGPEPAATAPVVAEQEAGLPVVAGAIQTPPPAPVIAAAPLQTPPRDVWERIRNGYALPAMDNDLVRTWETRYLAKPDYLARMVERSSHYLFHIVEEIERRKMPAEIALLPMIESAYNPQAYSRAHAAGLWQFIPSTGRLYGLRQNWWYDGRRDVIAATSAALDYLEKLHAQFGDWELALASYNWGEGAVSRAMARNQARGLPTDYASLNMPAETRNYLPKLIAVKNIISDPARFGIQLASVPNEPYFATLPVTQPIDVRLAAKLAEMPLEEFRFLNPAHNKPVIKAGTAETIVLPQDKVAVFQANLRNHDQPLVSWQAHVLKAGEKPEKVAAHYNIHLAELKRVNNITGKNRFRTGQSLLVPVKVGMKPHLPDLPATPVSLPKAYRTASSKNQKQVSRTRTARSTPAKQRAPAKGRAVAVKKPAPKNEKSAKVFVAQNRE